MPKPKRTVSRISDAVWAHIFELAVNFIPGYTDIHALRDGRARNKTLTAFALCANVGRRWLRRFCSATSRSVWSNPTPSADLRCSASTTTASLAAYTRLETLDMRGCANPIQLLSGALPPGLRKLQFGLQSFNSPDAVKQLKSALRRVKSIKSVCVFHNRYSGGASDFTPPKLHVPVHVVYESYVTDDIIPCPYNAAVAATTVPKAKPSKR